MLLPSDYWGRNRRENRRRTEHTADVVSVKCPKDSAVQDDSNVNAMFSAKTSTVAYWKGAAFITTLLSVARYTDVTSSGFHYIVIGSNSFPLQLNGTIYSLFF